MRQRINVCTRGKRKRELHYKEATGTAIPVPARAMTSK